MNEKQIGELSQELSEDELNELAAGQMSPETKKKVLKYVGIGVGSAAALTGAGIGIAALVGWRTGKGAFGYLYDDSKLEITAPEVDHEKMGQTNYGKTLAGMQAAKRENNPPAVYPDTTVDAGGLADWSQS